MKTKKIIILEKILKAMAVAVLWRHKPKIVAITGSVGKTSTKAAIFEVLSSQFHVRENQKNYNNEIGIPLTIIGVPSGEKNPFKWLLVFAGWLRTIISVKYPDILILELGIDRPGDMKYFMSFIRPMVSIVTNVSYSHIEFFKTIENIAKEKRVIIETLEKEGWAILNGDDENTLKMVEHTNAQVMTFGQSENVNFNASHVVYNYENNKPEGISFKLSYDGKNIPIRLRNILADHYVYPALAAIATGIVFKLNLVEIAKALESFRSPSGRMNLMPGINESFVIDDTYNASPMSTLAALGVLEKLEATRKIAVLADMLELGDQTESGHKEVGKKVFDSKIDIFVAIGERMKFASAQLASLGFPMENIIQFDDSISAGNHLREILKQGDFVLVKGSQGMRTEKIVEKIMKNPSEAKNILCRQSKEWRKRPLTKP